MRNSLINIAAYVDYIEIIGDAKKAVERMCKKLITMAGKVLLDIRNQKMEYMMIRHQARENQLGQFINVEGHMIKSYSF